MEKLIDCIQTGMPLRLIPVGSYRRGKSNPGDLDMLAVSRTGTFPENFIDLLHVKITKIIANGPRRITIMVKGRQVDFFVTKAKDLPYALLHFTGPYKYNIRLRALAKQKGLKLNQYGLFRGDTKIILRSERAICKYLGANYYEPENRKKFE